QVANRHGLRSSCAAVVHATPGPHAAGKAHRVSPFNPGAVGGISPGEGGKMESHTSSAPFGLQPPLLDTTQETLENGRLNPRKITPGAGCASREAPSGPREGVIERGLRQPATASRAEPLSPYSGGIPRG